MSKLTEEEMYDMTRSFFNGSLRESVEQLDNQSVEDFDKQVKHIMHAIRHLCKSLPEASPGRRMFVSALTRIQDAAHEHELWNGEK